jgi:hypothetical protein
MTSVGWKEFEASAPELARFGRERLHGRVSYLATIRKNNLPRLHPLTPIIGDGHLYVFMEPTSPKGKDLDRGSAYVLHSSVADNEGSNGEFQLTGYADRVRDATARQQAVALCPYEPEARYILFELRVLEALSTVYRDDRVVRARWKPSAP